MLKNLDMFVSGMTQASGVAAIPVFTVLVDQQVLSPEFSDETSSSFKYVYGTNLAQMPAIKSLYERQTPVRELMYKINSLIMGERAREFCFPWQVEELMKLSPERLRSLDSSISIVHSLLNTVREGATKIPTQSLIETAETVLDSQVLASKARREDRNLTVWLDHCKVALLSADLVKGESEKRKAHIASAGRHLLAMHEYSSDCLPLKFQNILNDAIVDELTAALLMPVDEERRYTQPQMLPQEESVLNSSTTVHTYHNEQLKLYTQHIFDDILRDLRDFMPNGFLTTGVILFFRAYKIMPLRLNNGMEFRYSFGERPLGIGSDRLDIETRFKAIRGLDVQGKYVPETLGELIDRGGMQSVYHGRNDYVLKFAKIKTVEDMHLISSILTAYDVPHLVLGEDETAMKIAAYGVTVQRLLPEGAVRLHSGKTEDFFLIENSCGRLPETEREELSRELSEFRRKIDKINEDQELKAKYSVRSGLRVRKGTNKYSEAFVLDGKGSNIYFIREGIDFHGRKVHFVLVDW